MLLSERAYCVSALAIKLGLSAPAVSQHLRILRDAQIVTCEKYGYHTHYMPVQETLDSLCDETPLCRIGEPSEVASVALFLAGEGASFITGEVLNISGGFVI